MDCSSVVEKDGTCVLLHSSGSGWRVTPVRPWPLILKVWFYWPIFKDFLFFLLTFTVMLGEWARLATKWQVLDLEFVFAGADFGKNICWVCVTHPQVGHQGGIVCPQEWIGAHFEVEG